MSSSAHRFKVNSALRNFVNLCEDASEELVQEIVQKIGEGAAARAPVGETGELQSSMRTETDTKYGNIQGRVVFGSKEGMEYVVVQHEHTDFEHAHGEAKFLEKEVLDLTPEIRNRLASGLKQKVMGGGG